MKHLNIGIVKSLYLLLSIGTAITIGGIFIAMFVEGGIINGNLTFKLSPIITIPLLVLYCINIIYIWETKIDYSSARYPFHVLFLLSPLAMLLKII